MIAARYIHHKTEFGIYHLGDFDPPTWFSRNDCVYESILKQARAFSFTTDSDQFNSQVFIELVRSSSFGSRTSSWRLNVAEGSNPIEPENYNETCPPNTYFFLNQHE